MNTEIKSIEEHSKVFPIQEIENIREHKLEYIGILFDSIKYVIENAENLRKSKSKYFLHIYAIYLLAEFREQCAFPLITDFVQLSQKQYEFLSHDVVTDKLASIFASTYNGEHQLLERIIENKEISEYIRSSAIQAYKVLVNEGIIPIISFEQYLRDFIERKLDAGPEDDQNAFVFITLIIVITELNLYDLRYIVHKLYENGFIDTFFVGDYPDFIDDLFKKHNIRETLIDDAINELISLKKFSNSKQYKQRTVKGSKRKDYPTWHNSDSPDEALKNFPAISGKQGLKGLSEFYSQDAIDIDIAMYKALSKSKSYNMFFDAFTSLMGDHDESNNDEPDMISEQFELAYRLFLAKATKDNIKRLESYDKKHMIHYSIEDFLGEYFTHLLSKYRKSGEWDYKLQLIETMEEVLERFTLNRDIRHFSTGN